MAENKETKSTPNNTGEKKTDSGYVLLFCALLWLRFSPLISVYSVFFLKNQLEFWVFKFFNFFDFFDLICSRYELESNWDERVESFDNMGLREELLRGIYSYGFERPSVIQQKGIVPLLRYYFRINISCLQNL
jgi:hypothetical protein